jgi:hypothetical protein
MATRLEPNDDILDRRAQEDRGPSSPLPDGFVRA